MKTVKAGEARYPLCRTCKGAGEIKCIYNWLRFAVHPPDMTGEITIYHLAVCAACHGCGMDLRNPLYNVVTP